MFRLLTTITLLVFAHSAIAQSIEIKGLHVGMPKAEVQEKFPTWKDFTIAGVRSKFVLTPVSIEYRDDKIDKLTFFFDSSSFETVLGAIKEKYPETICKSTQVRNAMGATFEQIQCLLKGGESDLLLSRYISDIRTSMLAVASKKSQEEQAEKGKQRKKDI